MRQTDRRSDRLRLGLITLQNSVIATCLLTHQSQYAQYKKVLSHISLLVSLHSLNLFQFANAHTLPDTTMRRIAHFPNGISIKAGIVSLNRKALSVDTP